MIKIKKGLDLPIAGTPEQVVDNTSKIRTVGILGSDYTGMKPTMAVAEGDQVKRGQLLFTDKKNPGVRFTAPVSGRISAIHRGAKRALESVVIELAGDDAAPIEALSSVGALSGLSALGEIQRLDRQTVVAALVECGLWTAIRCRPFNKIPAIDSSPRAIFVTAMDTNPLAIDAKVVIDGSAEDFTCGLDLIAKLTDGTVHVCQASGSAVPTGTATNIQAQEFSGPHPAGLPGTHIHFLDPVSATKTVWFVGYQDVISIGRTFAQGSLNSERIIAIGGPGVKNPRLIKTVLGASMLELCTGELLPGEQRAISGSVLAGRFAEGNTAYLGRYHQQISVLPEDRKRHFLGYLAPGFKQHSVTPAYLSSWVPGNKILEFSTTTNGSPRAMVPIGTFESVMPLDILPTQLLRSLLVGDIEAAIALGCLELDEDDIALCTYACPGKYEYAPVLRDMLNQIEKEG